MKKGRINIIILLIASFFVLYFSLKGNIKGVLDAFSNINCIYFIPLIALFLLSLFFKALGLNIFIREHDNKYSIKKAFKLVLIGQFVNGITPFQSGGQPYLIYLLKKEGKRITDMINTMIKDQLSYQLALIIVSSLFVFLNFRFNLYVDFVNNTLVLFGFLVNLFVLFILAFVITAKNTEIKLINKIINFIFKFKIVNKFKLDKEKLNDSLKNFYKSGKEIRKNKLKFFKATMYNCLNIVILYIIPWFVFAAFGIYIPLIKVLTATSFIMLIGNFIPIPGATGGIEFSFMSFCSRFVNDGILSSAMLLWRFITYVFGMIIGFITLLLRKENKK